MTYGAVSIDSENIFVDRTHHITKDKSNSPPVENGESERSGFADTLFAYTTRLNTTFS